MGFPARLFADAGRKVDLCTTSNLALMFYQRRVLEAFGFSTPYEWRTLSERSRKWLNGELTVRPLYPKSTLNHKRPKSNCLFKYGLCAHAP